MFFEWLLFDLQPHLEISIDGYGHNDNADETDLHVDNNDDSSIDMREIRERQRNRERQIERE